MEGPGRLGPFSLAQLEIDPRLPGTALSALQADWAFLSSGALKSNPARPQWRGWDPQADLAGSRWIGVSDHLHVRRTPVTGARATPVTQFVAGI